MSYGHFMFFCIFAIEKIKSISSKLLINYVAHVHDKFFIESTIWTYEVTIGVAHPTT